MTRKTCVICGRVITEHFYVCMKYIKTYDIPYKYRDWPRWLKDLVNIEIKNLAIMRMEERHYRVEADGEDSSLGRVHEKDIVKTF